MIVEVGGEENHTITDFDKAIKNGNIIVLFYANWCGYCQMMKPNWDKFKTECNDKHKNINIAEVESSMMSESKYAKHAQGYPTIAFFHKNKTEPTIFDGPRESKSLLEFAMKNTITPKTHNTKKNNHTNNNINKKHLIKKTTKKTKKQDSKLNKIMPTVNNEPPTMMITEPELEKLVFSDEEVNNIATDNTATMKKSKGKKLKGYKTKKPKSKKVKTKTLKLSKQSKKDINELRDMAASLFSPKK